MKKITKPLSIFLLAITTFALGAGLVSSSSAQDAPSENPLLQKLDALVDQLSNLTNQSNTSSNSQGEYSLEANSSGHQYPSCVDNYLSWPNSTTEKTDPEWSLKNFSALQTSYNLGLVDRFIDVNGDGLTDYVFMEKHSTGKYGSECLLLNNGTGWDVAYQCRYNSAGFWGDCAQI